MERLTVTHWGLRLPIGIVPMATLLPSGRAVIRVRTASVPRRDAASALLATADLCPLDDYQRARAERLRAQVTFSLTRGSDALPLLLDSAKGPAAFGTRDLPRSGPPDPITALVRGLATAFTEGFAASVPPPRMALEAFREADDDAIDVNRWLWLL